MGKINRSDFRSGMLGPDDIEDAAMLTVEAYQDGDRNDGGGKWALLRFEETGDKPLFLTGAAIETMIAFYGDETDEWIGQTVPVETYDHKNGKAVRIMATEEWEAAFKEAGETPPARIKPVKAARPAPRAAGARPGVRPGVRRGVKRGKKR